MLDFAALDSRTRSIAGVDMIVKDPRTGRAWKNAAGEDAKIAFHGYNSPAFEAAQAAANEHRAALAARDIQMTREELRAERAAIVAACTMGWNFDAMDGQPFAYSPDNAVTLWEDKRVDWLLGVAYSFIMNEANFLAGTPAG
jgi:hypothetical protein